MPQNYFRPNIFMDPKFFGPNLYFYLKFVWTVETMKYFKLISIKLGSICLCSLTVSTWSEPQLSSACIQMFWLGVLFLKSIFALKPLAPVGRFEYHEPYKPKKIFLSYKGVCMIFPCIFTNLNIWKCCFCPWFNKYYI